MDVYTSWTYSHTSNAMDGCIFGNPKLNIPNGPWPQPPSTLLYPVSLLIGYWDWVQGGNPLFRQWNVWVAAEAKFDGFFSFLLQKGHGTSNSWPQNFFRGPKKFLSPPNWLFFGSSVTFPELRDHFQNLHLLIIFSLPRKSSGNLQ